MGIRALVVGGDCKVGQGLIRALQDPPGKNNLQVTTRRAFDPINTWWHKLDLLDPQLPVVECQVMYLVAAITKIVDCEADPAKAWRINADAPVALALAFRALSKRSHTIFISSDAVERAPNLIYSRTKAYVESVLLPLGATIARPSAMGTDPNKYEAFGKKLVELGEAQPGGVVRWTP